MPVLASLLKYAKAFHFRRKGSNPCRSLPRYPREAKERYVSRIGYCRLGAALRDAEATHPAQVAIVRALAEVGISFQYPYRYQTKARSTTWFAHERGFGLRQYAMGCEVYIARTRMAGRLRTVTIAPTSIITQHRALTVACSAIAYTQVGHEPANDRKRIRAAPGFDDFLDEYWRRWSPQ